MAKDNPLDILMKGVEAWNAWRSQQDEDTFDFEEPNLSRHSFGEMDFSGANFRQTVFNHTNFVDNTVTGKAVLILGRFTPERKAVLDSVSRKLRTHNYLPIIFDFEGPTSRDLQETVSTLARLVRFIIADITDPKSVPQELVSIVPQLPSVPVQPLLKRGHEPWSMFSAIARYPWVLPIYEYDHVEDLLTSLEERVIAPAEVKAEDQRRLREETERELSQLGKKNR